MASIQLKVEQWPIDRLIPYARNPRKNDEQVDRMAGSIREFGFRIPIVAKSDGTVVDGHLRLKAAHKLGLSEVPVALADELTEAQVKAFRLLANQSANWADWDMDLLKLELEDLKNLGVDIDIIGFSPDFLSEAGESPSVEKIINDSEKYTKKVTTPIYEPLGLDVSFETMCNDAKTRELIRKIEASNVSEAEKAFLIEAAHRHTVFNYQHIAEYYCAKASPEMKALMEDSALVIIDVDDAIAKGFVTLSTKIEKIVADDEK